MDGSFDDDEPFIFRLNENGSGPGLLVKVHTTSSLVHFCSVLVEYLYVNKA